MFNKKSFIALMFASAIILSMPLQTEARTKATKRTAKQQNSQAINTNNLKLISINIIDRNGLSETTCAKDKLNQFAKTNFMLPQVYKKVLRQYKNSTGELTGILTSYHENGNIKQYLESLNNRALGSFKEWFANGQLKIDAHIIGGIADLHQAAEDSWLFDGLCSAYNEVGSIVAKILYSKGQLHGCSIYYHANGRIWQEKSFKNNMLDGWNKTFLNDGSLLQETFFTNGNKDGISKRFHKNNLIAHEETYENNKLIHGIYFNKDGQIISRIDNGVGKKAIFGHKSLKEFVEYSDGKQNGFVKVFDETSGNIIQEYEMINSLKHKEEKFYYNNGQIKMLLTREHGILQGPSKTWYETGKLESVKEFYQNKKNGLLTVWYPSGKVMMIEEYENNKLLKGEYFKPDDCIAYTKVDKGSGTATIFTPSGILQQKIIYQDGVPIA